MRYYLDTNCVRQISKCGPFGKNEVFTSALSIFEIISGITSEKEYSIRKNILKAIKKSDLKILWKLPSAIMVESFNLPSKYLFEDSESAKIMMDEIIKSNDYVEFLDLKFNLGGEDYTYKTFIDHDNEINLVSKESINYSISTLNKEERKALKEFTLDSSTLRFQKEITIRNLLHKQLNINNNDDPQYLNSLDHYFQNNQLDNYFTLLIFLPLIAVTNGSNAGSNDGMDYQHLIYTHEIDFFVSSDKFYKRIPNNVREHIDFEFINNESFFCNMQNTE